MNPGRRMGPELGQAVAGACPGHELIGVDAARDVIVGIGESVGVDLQAFHLVAMDGVFYASLAFSAVMLGSDLLVRHGISSRYFILPSTDSALDDTEPACPLTACANPDDG